MNPIKSSVRMVYVLARDSSVTEIGTAMMIQMKGTVVRYFVLY